MLAEIIIAAVIALDAILFIRAYRQTSHTSRE